LDDLNNKERSEPCSKKKAFAKKKSVWTMENTFSLAHDGDKKQPQ
jgi:hypothetical protein